MVTYLPEKAHEIGLNAFKYVEKYFLINNMGENLFKLILENIEKHREIK